MSSAQLREPWNPIMTASYAYNRECESDVQVGYCDSVARCVMRPKLRFSAFMARMVLKPSGSILWHMSNNEWGKGRLCFMIHYVTHVSENKV